MAWNFDRARGAELLKKFQLMLGVPAVCFDILISVDEFQFLILIQFDRIFES